MKPAGTCAATYATASAYDMDVRQNWLRMTVTPSAATGPPTLEMSNPSYGRGGRVREAPGGGTKRRSNAFTLRYAARWRAAAISFTLGCVCTTRFVRPSTRVGTATACTAP